jgi:hypothetical protein
MALFKYLEPDRADIVEHLRIRFAPANGFNDPFECLPDSHLVEDPKWQRQNEDDCVREILADDAVQAAIHRRPRRWTEDRVRQYHRERYAMRVPELKNLAMEALISARALLRILCLSQVSPESADAFLLWGHYTENHRGLVIEFDSENTWIKGHEPVLGQPHDSGPVDYSESRPGWDADEHGLPRPRRELVFTKSTHWRYEKEFRLLRFADTPGLDASVVDSLVSFPPLALRSVTFGVNASHSVKERIFTTCARPELGHVRIRQAKIHPDNYELTVCDATNA